MTRDHASMWALPSTGLAGRLAASARRTLAAWRNLSWAHFLWAVGLGLVGSLLFLVSHSMQRVMNLLAHRYALGNTYWASTIAMAASAVFAVLLLLAVRVAEQGDRGQPRAWLRYVVATLVAVVPSAALVHLLSPYVPFTAFVGWYRLQSQNTVDSFVLANLLLFGGLAVFAYVRLMRVRRTQAAFERAELDRAAASRHLLRSQLAAMQAQVEPKFLFNTLGHIEAVYEHDTAGADRMLDDLIAYLRAALPKLRGEDSTLEREAELAKAYLCIIQARMGSRLKFDFNVPANLGATRFPPMLLLPLIDNAVRHGLEPLPLGGRIQVCAVVDADRLRLAVSDSGLTEANGLREGHGLTTLRKRLAGLYGAQATLSLSATQPHGVTATIEVPAHDHTRDHR